MEVVGEKLVVVNANVCRVFITWKSEIITNIMMEGTDESRGGH